jgi:hypothetical protein
MPKSVKQALEIDRDTNTSLWSDAIKKEMTNVMPAFKILEQDAPKPVAHTWIPCHMIFDIKMDFTRKARFVAGGHVTDPPSSITYASVVSRDSVRIALLIASLNSLDILGADAQNAYLNAPVREKVYTTCGPEFVKSMEGCYALIVCALYGLKSSGAAWRAHLAATMEELHFISCLADPDVWLRPAQKHNGTNYYEDVLVYTNDFLCISTDPKKILDSIGMHFKLKPESIETSEVYLGANLGHFTLPDSPSKQQWSMSSTNYVK